MCNIYVPAVWLSSTILIVRLIDNNKASRHSCLKGEVYQEPLLRMLLSIDSLSSFPLWSHHIAQSHKLPQKFLYFQKDFQAVSLDHLPLDTLNVIIVCNGTVEFLIIDVY